MINKNKKKKLLFKKISEHHCPDVPQQNHLESARASLLEFNTVLTCERGIQEAKSSGDYIQFIGVRWESKNTNGFL